ncbi:hypothetical protein Tco_0748483 [Tanacetum coccineum]|uniref:Uncharacterized protein n=1 Tax=Tanacetum coccineum TaxID=301880 RepID=A0ABQ4YYR6_9ASTR
MIALSTLDPDKSDTNFSERGKVTSGLSSLRLAEGSSNGGDEVGTDMGKGGGIPNNGAFDWWGRVTRFAGYYFGGGVVANSSVSNGSVSSVDGARSVAGKATTTESAEAGCSSSSSSPSASMSTHVPNSSVGLSSSSSVISPSTDRSTGSSRGPHRHLLGSPQDRLRWCLLGSLRARHANLERVRPGKSGLHIWVLLALPGRSRYRDHCSR